MKHIAFMFSILFLFLTISCASQKKESDAGFGFAKKIFDIWKDVAKDQLPKGSGQGGEIQIDRTKLAKPYTMAIYFLPATEKDQNWKWDRQEKDQLINTLEGAKETRRVFELINTGGGVSDLADLRYMAAQQGADALLLVRGVSATDSSVNGKALSYVLLIPMLVVKGNDVKGQFIAQAVLWDVKKPYVHFGSEAEGKWQMERPLIFRQKDRAVKKSREEAMKMLLLKVQREVQRL